MTVKFLGHIISFLDVKALIGITVGVLFNLCNDSGEWSHCWTHFFFAVWRYTSSYTYEASKNLW